MVKTRAEAQSASRLPARRRKDDLFRRYNITSYEWDRLHQSQDGRCALCRGTKTLYVDHDHTSGRVRGLLCSRCNGALGTLGDDEEGLLRAIEYVRAVA